MNGRGRFIVFEGGEGTGKSTQARLLADKLGALLTREPGGTATGEQIREILLHETDIALGARSELLLMVAARAQHVAEKIRPALEAGQDVVCDRYSGSTLAYQGFGRGLPLDVVEAACALAEDGVQADLSILLDVPVSVGLSRTSSVPDRIEDEGFAFHERVRKGFQTLADNNPDRWAIIDGSGDKSQVAARIDDVLSQRLTVSQ